jgi:hypothetical protein
MSTIPVSEVVNVTPSVLSAGGSALDLSGLVLTLSTRAPIGSVQSFASEIAVGNYFGSSSLEARNANKYFAGFDNSNKKPGAILFAQYPLAAVSAYLRGGNISGLTLTQLQALNGALNVTIDTVLKSGTPNLSGATSFSNAASIIALALGIQGAAKGTITGVLAGTVLTVSGYSGPALAVGDVVNGSGVTAGTYITSFGTGTGGNGTYNVNASQSVASESMTINYPAITYDSVSGAFVVVSPTTGASSAITFAGGALATSLLLTSATGAVLSQGAAPAVPAAFMNSVIQNTRKFATWMLNFNPDSSGNDIRFAFATWNGTQNGRYGFSAIDDDAAPTTTVPAVASLAQRIATAKVAGVICNWQPVQADPLDYGNLAAFVCGMAASIDFTQTNGRITFKFRQQSGLVPGVTDQTTFDNLKANGYNSYGAYADAGQNFVWYADGVVSGDFQWADSYVNQIWLSTFFKSTLVTLLQSTGSIPYNAPGRTKIEAALADPINAALNFGVFRAGVTLSASQIAAVNSSAGKNIADTLSNQGWYLLIGDADPATRVARGSPPMTFFYVDGQSVQAFSLASILLK